MSDLTAALRVKLIDDVSPRAKGVTSALRDAERKAKDMAKALSGVGGTDRLSNSLSRLGLSAKEIDKVGYSWREYVKSAGLAAKSTEWTKQQARDVRVWEQQVIGSLRRATAARREADKALAAAPPAGGMTAAGAGAGGAMALGARGLAMAGGAYGVARLGTSAVTDFAALDRQMRRIGMTADATSAQVAEATALVKSQAVAAAMPLQDVIKGLDALVASGRSLPSAMEFIPSVSRTAQASGAQMEEIAKTGEAVATHLGVAARDMQGAFDILVAGGKAGMFELKDMARYLPSMAPAAKALGMSGKEGLTQLVALLQIVRKGAGTSEEAAASMNNILQKMGSEETLKRFEKAGVNLEEAFKKGRAEGKSMIEVFEEATWKAIKGDLSNLPKLINDMEFSRGIRAILSMRGAWQQMSAEIARTAPGSTLRDFNEVSTDAAARIQNLTTSWENFKTALGAKVAPGGIKVFEALTRFVEGKIFENNGSSVRSAAEAWRDAKIAAGGSGSGWEDYGLSIVDPRKSATGEVSIRPGVTLDQARAAGEAAGRAERAAREEALLAAPARLRAQRDAGAWTNMPRGMAEARNRRYEAAIAAAETAAAGVMASRAARDPVRLRSMIAPQGGDASVGGGRTMFGFGAGGSRVDGPISAAAAAPQVDASSVDAAKQKADAARQALDGLSGPVSLAVDATSISAALDMAGRLEATLTRIGSKSATIGQALPGSLAAAQRSRFTSSGLQGE